MRKEEIEFLKESNAIEGEFSKKALEDAMGAWAFAKEMKHALDLRIILKIHRILMRRCNQTIAGKWRVNKSVSVGKDFLSAKSKYLIRKEVQDWLDECKTHTGLGAEEDIKRRHVKFEKIHPFIDGNGRIGRILMNAQRLNVNLPILIIKNSEKQDYYKWFEEKYDVFPCLKCGAPTKSQYCDACFGSRCKACGRNSYGKDFCYYCWRKR